jgi:hypothetical protein
VFLLVSDKANRNKNADTNTNLFDLSTTTEELCDLTAPPSGGKGRKMKNRKKCIGVYIQSYSLTRFSPQTTKQGHSHLEFASRLLFTSPNSNRSKWRRSVLSPSLISVKGCAALFQSFFF